MSTKIKSINLPEIVNDEIWWRVDFIREGNFLFRKFVSQSKALEWVTEQRKQEGFKFLQVYPAKGYMLGET